MREDLEVDLARLRREQAAWEAARPEALLSDPMDLRAAWGKPETDGGLSLATKREFLLRQLIAVQLAAPELDPQTGKQRRPRTFDPYNRSTRHARPIRPSTLSSRDSSP